MRPQQVAEHARPVTSAEARALRLSLYVTAAAVIWAIGLIVLGAMLSASGAATSCSGWPLCDGQLSPTSDFDGTLTFGHRLGGLSILILSAVLVGITQVRLKRDSTIQRLALAAFTLILLQSVVGGYSVVEDLPGYAISSHLMLAVAVAGTLVGTLVVIRRQLVLTDASAGKPLSLPRELTGLARGIAVTVPLLLLLASAVDLPRQVERASAGSIPGEPGGAMAWIVILSGLLALMLGAFLADTLRSSALNAASRLVALVAATAVMLAIGTATVFTLVAASDYLGVIPMALVVSGWAGIVALVTGTTLSQQAPLVVIPDAATVRTMLRDFARVTKPAIMVLLLITTLGAMLIAAQGWPSLWLVLLTMLGGAMASGGASALNCYYDRDIDGVMARTRKRPIPTGGLSPDQVRAWGILLSVASVGVLAAFVNPLAATMALAGNVFYVLIYTRKLKRTTPQNIVIGGAAGSFPPLVGWAAVTGSLSLGAFLIAAIVFYWTPPHFWSLALLKANDYKRAGIPMLPVTHGEHETRRRIVLYSFLLLGVTLLMVPAGVVGLIYGVTAAVLGVWFVVMAIRMFREDTSRLAWPLFKFSNYYLAALLAAMAIDHAFKL